MVHQTEEDMARREEVIEEDMETLMAAVDLGLLDLTLPVEWQRER